MKRNCLLILILLTAPVLWSQPDHLFRIDPGNIQDQCVGLIALGEEGEDYTYSLIAGNNLRTDNHLYHPFRVNAHTGELLVEDAAALENSVSGRYELKILATHPSGDLREIEVVVIAERNYPEGEEIAARITIFPNPVSSGYFQLSSPAGFKEVKVSNIIGQELYHVEYPEKKKKLRVDLPGADQGLYLVTITYSPRQKVVRKILVK